jgi:membrane protein implicated in regulation of membrane protease activity
MAWQEADWLLWLAAALAAGVIEIITVDFFFLMIAGGALATAIAAGAGVPGPLQVLVFALSSSGLLFGVRPPLKRWVRNTPELAMNVDALVGRSAVVLETVTERAGLVKLAGEVWTARPAAGLTSIEVGSAVHVLRIEGATAVVTPDVASPPNSLEGRAL